MCADNDEGTIDDMDDLPGCSSRLKSECCSCSGWFTIHEGTKTLDIPNTFCNRHVGTLIGKIIVTTWAVFIMITALSIAKHVYFYYAYLTSWSELFSVIYLLMSLFNSFFPTKQPQKKQQKQENIGKLGGNSDTIPSVWICMTWVMAIIALHISTIITLLYWTLVFDPEVNHINYVGVMHHGGILVLVFIDVLVLNRVPVRWKHLLFPQIPLLLYAIWTVIHDITDIGNPNSVNDEIYRVVAWEENWQRTLIVFVLAFFVTSPILYAITWIIALYSFPCSLKGANRRYIQGNVHNDELQKLASNDEETVVM